MANVIASQRTVHPMTGRLLGIVKENSTRMIHRLQAWILEDPLYFKEICYRFK